MEIRKINVELPDGRVETGPVKFNDDWNGVFIRGDSAHGYLIYLQQMVNEPELFEKDVFCKIMIEDLIDLLKSCYER